MNASQFQFKVYFLGHIRFSRCLGAHGTGSSSATHPAAVFGPGGRPAGDSIVAERVTKGAVEQVYWRYEDQLNSCVGQADENGWRTMQNSYLAFGEVMQSRVLYDGAIGRVSTVEYDGLALTTITLANNDLSTDLLNGALLFLARPGYSGDRHMEAVVVDTTSTTIVIADAAGAMSEALGPEGRPIASFVIFAFNDSKQANAPTYQTHGTWTSAPSNTGGAAGTTTFTDVDADDNGGGFASWMIGALLVPDVNIGAPLIITGTTATTLTVAGDARGVAANGTRYIVYAAPFVNPAHGAWQTDPHKGGTRYLWAGYRYQPPQMGFWVDPPGAPGLGVYGAATGVNRLGQYYCWNRTYDLNLGRWTTPDPVATPWWNLADYCSTRPNRNSDTSGLFVSVLRDVLDTLEHVALRTLLRKLGVKIFPRPGVTTGDLRELMRLRRSAPRHLVKGADGVSLGPDPGNPGGFIGFPKGGGRREIIVDKPQEETPPEDNCGKRRTTQAPIDFRAMEVGIEALSGWIRAGHNAASKMTDITTSSHFWNFELVTDPATGKLVGKLVEYNCGGSCETGKNCKIVEVDSVDSNVDDDPPGTQTPIHGCACD